MAQFTRYSSADDSAPVLSGTAGALINVLDKVLVTGYGNKSPAGWSKPYTGANKAAFCLGAGTMQYLRILEDGSTTGGQREATVTGYSTMSDVDTGSNAATAPVWYKAKTADANATAWVIYADARTMYFFVESTTASRRLCFSFGDYFSFSNDSYACALVGCAANASPGGIAQARMMVSDYCGTSITNQLVMGKFGVAGAVTVGCHGDAAKVGSNQRLAASSSLAAVNAGDGTIFLSPIYIHDTSGTVLGYRRGLWQAPYRGGVLSDNQLITGANEFAGREFRVLAGCITPTDTGDYPLVVETSDTLDTNTL